MVETIQQKTVEIELGPQQTNDLKELERQIESLKNRVQKLQTDLSQRIRNFEINIQDLHKQRDEKIAGLRAEYDKQLDRGNADLADQCLGKIKKERKELENIARNILDSDSDTSDLKTREKTLHSEAQELYKLANANFNLAKTLMEQAAGITGTVTSSIGRDFLKLEKILSDNRKIAERILSE